MNNPTESNDQNDDDIPFKLTLINSNNGFISSNSQNPKQYSQPAQFSGQPAGYSGCDKCLAKSGVCVLNSIVPGCLQAGIGISVCLFLDSAECSYTEVGLNALSCIIPLVSYAQNAYCIYNAIKECVTGPYLRKNRQFMINYKEDIFPLIVIAQNGIISSAKILTEYYEEDVWLSENAQEWLKYNFNPFLSDISDSSRYISKNEASILLNSSRAALPNNVSYESVQKLIDRFNNTQILLDKGQIVNSNNLINISYIRDLSKTIKWARDIALSYGYESLALWLKDNLKEFDNAPEKAGVCTRIRLLISQSLVLTRQGFEASLSINNQENVPLNNLSVKIQIKNETNISNDLFSIGQPSLEQISSVDGNGSLDAMQQATIRWLILPYREAAQDTQKVYFVSGVLEYFLNKEKILIDIAPERITVNPEARLELVYFLEKYIKGDDPMTSEVEPSIPFSLGLLLFNTGYGVAKQLRILSSQPEIIENDRGLLIDFRIESAFLNNKQTENSLKINFGDVEPLSFKHVIWNLKSSLMGTFSNLSVAFTNVNPNGDEKLSLIENIEYKELFRLVKIDRPQYLNDDLSDFLTIDPFFAYPNQVFVSNVTNFKLNVSKLEPFRLLNETKSNAKIKTDQQNLFIYINEWFYSYAIMPLRKQKITKVVRSDGRICSLDNFWLNDFNASSMALNIFDYIENTTISSNIQFMYTIEFRDTLNINVPQFSQSVFEFFIDNSFGINSTIGKLTAIGLDDDNLGFELVNGTEYMQVNLKSGELMILKQIDADLVFKARVFELNTSSSISTECLVKIVWLDSLSEDIVPIFDSDTYAVKILDNTPINTLVFMFNASNRLTIKKNLTFFILSGNDKNEFYLEANTGKLFLKKTVEPSSTFNLTIQAGYF